MPPTAGDDWKPPGDLKPQPRADAADAAEARLTLAEATGRFDSHAAQRTENNVMRHQYRPLDDGEKKTMQDIKDRGLSLHQLFEAMGSSRELSIAKTKLEESVMWAVKHLTK